MAGNIGDYGRDILEEVNRARLKSSIVFKNPRCHPITSRTGATHNHDFRVRIGVQVCCRGETVKQIGVGGKALRRLPAVESPGYSERSAWRAGCFPVPDEFPILVHGAWAKDYFLFAVQIQINDQRRLVEAGAAEVFYRLRRGAGMQPANGPIRVEACFAFDDLTLPITVQIRNCNAAKFGDLRAGPTICAIVVEAVDSVGVVCAVREYLRLTVSVYIPHCD